jgi:DNA-binding transcriptional regulator GbsR (MarR family)
LFVKAAKLRDVPRDAQLTFADHVGRFYARQYGFPPMAGRLLGYLFVCDPPQQTIDELGEALLASRSAITGAVKLLESFRMARRTRAAGERTDRVSLDPVSQQPQNFDSAIHQQHAALFREGLALLADAPPERRAPLEEMVALAEYLGERLPALLDEWHTYRDELRASGKLPTPGGSRADPTGTRKTSGRPARGHNHWEVVHRD